MEILKSPRKGQTKKLRKGTSQKPKEKEEGAGSGGGQCEMTAKLASQGGKEEVQPEP